MSTSSIHLVSSAPNCLLFCFHQLWEQKNKQQEGWFATFHVLLLLDFVSQPSSEEVRAVLEAAVLRTPSWE